MIPVYKLHIGSLSIDATQLTTAGYPVDVLVDLRLNGINTARLGLRGVSGSTLQPDDPVTVELGEDEAISTVFTGLVSDIKKRIDGWTIYGRSSLAALVNTRVNELHEKQKAGDIVRDVDLSVPGGLRHQRRHSGPHRPALRPQGGNRYRTRILTPTAF